MSQGRASKLRENVIIAYRGASYEIGRGQSFYAIWPNGQSGTPPKEWWPATPEGWSAAWRRFTQLQSPDSIAAVTGPAVSGGEPGEPLGQPSAPLRPAGSTAALAGSRVGAIAAGSTIGIGVILGVIGLFPGYFGSQSLAHQAADLVPHLIYLAAWGVSAVLIVLGGSRVRTGALLGIGTSLVTFGLFIADAGTAISAGPHVAGTGLVLGLVSWLACAAGSGLAILFRPAGATTARRVRRIPLAPAITAILAAIGAAIAFAPSWDRYALATPTGFSQTITAGNAFANPGLVIAGDVAVMVAVVVAAIAAGLWRPARHGAVLLAGAIVPLVAQAISAVIQIRQTVPPSQFGLSPGQAAAIGLSVHSGLTLAFWVYCAFVVALTLSCGLIAGTGETEVPAAPAPYYGPVAGGTMASDPAPADIAPANSP